MSLTPSTFESSWDRIFPTIELLHGDSIEAVRAACETREAVVLEADDGFAVVSVQVQRNGDRELFVWAVAGRGGRTLRNHQAELSDMGRHLGCKRLVGRVRNERVAALLEHRGWKRTHVEYALEI